MRTRGVFGDSTLREGEPAKGRGTDQPHPNAARGV